MPLHGEAKRSYQKQYAAGNSEAWQRYRRKEVIQRAVKLGRLPSHKAIARHKITADELSQILKTFRLPGVVIHCAAPEDNACEQFTIIAPTAAVS